MRIRRFRLGALNVGRMTETVISVVVIMIVLAALVPVLINASSNLSTTISNETSLSPLQPLVDNLPLLLVLGFIVAIVFVAVKIYSSE